jgi:hypothetical protein
MYVSVPTIKYGMGLGPSMNLCQCHASIANGQVLWHQSSYKCRKKAQLVQTYQVAHSTYLSNPYYPNALS